MSTRNTLIGNARIPTPEETAAIIRRARAEQAAAIRNAILRLFRHRPAAPMAVAGHGASSQACA